MMEHLAMLPKDQQDAVLRDLDMEQLVWDWNAWARPEQLPPKTDDWAIWMYLAGRGAGKTRSAAEWVREKAKDTSQGQLRFALVARTAADVYVDLSSTTPGPMRSRHGVNHLTRQE